MTNQKNGTLYIGTTRHLEYRIWQHKNKVQKGFTQKYDLQMLVYYEEYEWAEDAILREKQMKKWNRAWKIKCIGDQNPDWRDISKDWEEHGSPPARG